jgi:hypothetical protein
MVAWAAAACGSAKDSVTDPSTDTGTQDPPPPEYGLVVGAITDPFGGPLADVTVSLTGGATPMKATTDDKGSFSLTGVQTGSYTLSLKRDGFNDKSGTVSVTANQTTRVDQSMDPESLPSAATLGARITGTSGSRLDFEVDVAVVDADATPYGSLSSTSFSIEDFDVLHFARTSVTGQSGSDQGAYSAVLLMDQSGSIQTTDPADSRIQAGKTFFAALSAPDNAMLAAFSSGGSLPYDPITTWGTYTSDGTSFFGPLDQLPGLEGGGTPLYASTATMVDDVYANGTNANKAVLVFTDGEDTDGSWTLDDLINYARSRSVKIFTMGLSNSVDFKVLNRMAQETGGAMMWAGDARQLVSMYGSLGAILRGSITFYRTRWSVTSSDGSSWTTGSWFTTGIDVSTPVGTLATPIYVEVGMPNGAPAAGDGAAASGGRHGRRCVLPAPGKGTAPWVCLAR